MSEESALQIIEQGVAGVVNIDENAYARAFQRYLQSAEILLAAQKRVALAWFRENYPDLHVDITQRKSLHNGNLYFTMMLTVDNPELVPGGTPQLGEELGRYLDLIAPS